MAAPARQTTESNVRGNYLWVAQACPTCEGARMKRIGRRGGSAHRAHLGVECDIWRCDNCGLIFPNPMPIPVNDFEQHYGVEPDVYFEHHELDAKAMSAAHLLARAEELTGSKGKLLDIGAGRGELLRAARELGWNVSGIEPSARFAEYAAAYSGARISSLPLEQCDFAANSFDCVVLSAVLEHLYNPDETIREISRVLRRGGAVFIDVPNEAGLYFRVGNLYQKLRGRDWVVNIAPTFSPFHVFGFSPRSLKALLAKHGLSPRWWTVYPGRAMVPSRPGLVGKLERLAANAVTLASSMGSLGTYIETWAVKL
jgi:2-polyprenyl-3-methyl-5-hydroxy-6-metoxy-1,4-benzoquinol methylase/ribosomal protein L37AE/L43A